jgi:tetratricopeptide (TPR) repeat protein
VEIVGYHLEQAYLLSTGLGRKDDRIEKVGRRAARHLTSAGRRALNRGDMSAAANLLQRTAALLPRDDRDRAVVLPELAVALTETGEFAKAEAVLADALDVAGRRKDDVVLWYARLERIRLRVMSEPEGAYQQALQDAEQAIPFFVRVGDQRGLAKTLNLAAHAQYDLGKVTVAEEAWRRAVEHAEAAGDRRELAESLSWLALAARFGPSPAPRGIELCDRILDKAQGDRKVHAYVLDARCVLEAMLGRFSQGRRSARRAQELYNDLGLKVMGANLPQNSGFVEMLAGDAVAAEKEYRRGYELLEDMGERGFLSVVAALLADALYCQGRFEEAEQFTRVTEEAAASDDVSAQAFWRSVRAKVLAQWGEGKRAYDLAREAVRMVDDTEWLDDQAELRMSLGEVLRLHGRLANSVEIVEEALQLYEQKGNIVSAAKARRLMAELTGEPAAGDDVEGHKRGVVR